MIIDFKINCNTYEEKILNKKDFFTYNCPTCGAKHSFTRHASYKRNIILLSEDTLVDKKLKILRLKCSSCNKTHAILPNDIVPYCIYSYSIMIKILYQHLIDKESVLSLSNKYSISFQLIYFFISKLHSFFNECMHVLRLLNLFSHISTPTINDILINITTTPLKEYFQKIFFNKTKWMFLMKKFLNIIPKPIIIGAYDT